MHIKDLLIPLMLLSMGIMFLYRVITDELF